VAFDDPFSTITANNRDIAAFASHVSIKKVVTAFNGNL
jgi:hypothetical protein